MLPAGYTNAVAVTPHDTNPIVAVGGVTLPVAALYIGGAGSVNVTMVGGQQVALAGALAGTYLYGRFTHVRTGGTATNIVAFW